jgi:hypothetical protein
MFKVKFWERLESPPQEPFEGVVEPGFRAPDRVVLVVRKGTGWFLSQDGTRKAADAMTVVIYESGDWIEYASNGSGDAFEAELYGAAFLTEEQQAARLTRAFRP